MKIKLSTIVLISIGWTISLFAQSSTEIKLKTYLQRAADLERLSGVVFIKKGSSMILKQSYGSADFQENLPNSVTTAFDIGSISKQFTAAAILKLCQENKIKLDDPINLHLDNFASKRWEKITIHHLLTHQSGIPSVLQSGQGLDHYWPKNEPICRKDQWDYFKNLKLLDSLGEEFSYSNTGYIILAYIIEKVSGKSYEGFMRDHIFLPNGLSSTSVGSSVKGLTAKNHYSYKKEELEYAPDYHYSWALGAGGIHTTIDDLNKWFYLLQSGKIFNESLRKKMFTPYARNYGYGWVISESNGKKSISHDGTNFGATSFFLNLPEDSLTVIVLTNKTHKELHLLGKSEEWVRKVVYDIVDIIDGKEVKPLPQIVTVDKSEKSCSYVGSFELTGKYPFSLSVLNDTITMKTQADKYPVYRHYLHNEVALSDDPKAAKAIAASEALANRSYWKFGGYCDFQMKFVSYTFLLALGYNSIVKDLGEISKTVVYEIGEGYAITRFYGEKGNVDFKLVFNEDHQIQGIFDIGYSREKKQGKVVWLPTDSGDLFFDGFTMGEEDAFINLSANEEMDKLILRQGERKFSINRID